MSFADDLRALEPPTSEARPCPRCATAMVPLTRTYTDSNGHDTDPLVPSLECRACHLIVATETLREWGSTAALAALTREAQARGEDGDAAKGRAYRIFVEETGYEPDSIAGVAAMGRAFDRILAAYAAAPVRDAAGTGTVAYPDVRRAWNASQWPDGFDVDAEWDSLTADERAAVLAFAHRLDAARAGARP